MNVVLETDAVSRSTMSGGESKKPMRSDAARLFDPFRLQPGAAGAQALAAHRQPRDIAFKSG